MKIEIAPQETTRAEAFSLWMTSPMPMVTLTKTFNVSKLLRASKRRGVKFNALLCWSNMTMMTVVTMTYPPGESAVIIVTTVMKMGVLLEKIA